MDRFVARVAIRVVNSGSTGSLSYVGRGQHGEDGFGEAMMDVLSAHR